jgi:hypothetical protein
MNIPKKCIVCGKNYAANRNIQRFCSITCKTEYFNSIKRLSPKKDIPCEKCGKVFTTFKTGHSFCSKECRHDHDILNGRRAYDKIRKTNISILTAISSRNKRLSSIQKEIIYGSLLGDGHLALIPSNSLYALGLCHSEKQLDYLLFKIKKLDFLFQAKPYRYMRENTKSAIYSIKSISHGDITSIYNYFYRLKKRKITWKTLNLLTPTSLLIWYLDDGCNIPCYGSCKICTNAYSMSEVRMLSKWFWKKFKIKTTVQQQRKKTLDGNIKIYYSLYILKEYTSVFFNVLRSSEIFKEIPNCMSYKLQVN